MHCCYYFVCFFLVCIWYGSGSIILGWVPIQSGSRGFDDQKLKKIRLAKIRVHFFRIKNYNYLSLGLHKGRPSCKRSLQLSKENIQHFKKWNFLNFFLLLWVIFGLLNPDPDSEYGSGSIDPIEFGSNSDPNPDPQSCLVQFLLSQHWLYFCFLVSVTRNYLQC